MENEPSYGGSPFPMAGKTYLTNIWKAAVVILSLLPFPGHINTLARAGTRGHRRKEGRKSVCVKQGVDLGGLGSECDGRT